MKEKNTIKILVVSDSHGNNDGIYYAINAEFPFDYLVHCGDIEGRLVLPDLGSFKTISVKGNCDYDRELNTEELFKAGLYNVWVTHGDKYNVKYDLELAALKCAARERMADIVLFGHSHCAEIQKDDVTGCTLINSGSIGIPRTSAEKSTYAVITLTDDYDIIPEIKTINE